MKEKITNENIELLYKQLNNDDTFILLSIPDNLEEYIRKKDTSKFLSEIKKYIKFVKNKPTLSKVLEIELNQKKFGRINNTFEKNDLILMVRSRIGDILISCINNDIDFFYRALNIELIREINSIILERLWEYTTDAWFQSFEYQSIIISDEFINSFYSLFRILGRNEIMNYLFRRELISLNSIILGSDCLKITHDFNENIVLLFDFFNNIKRKRGAPPQYPKSMFKDFEEMMKNNGDNTIKKVPTKVAAFILKKNKYNIKKVDSFLKQYDAYCINKPTQKKLDQKIEHILKKIRSK